MTAAVIDGRLASLHTPLLHADDRGLRHGDGVFETMRVCGGQIVALSRHLARIQAGAQAIGIEAPSETELRRQGALLLAANPVERGEHVVRLIVTGGRGPGPRRPGPRGPGPRGPGEGPPTVLWTVGPLDGGRRAGLRARACPLPPRVRPDLKTLCYLPHVLAGLEGGDEAPLYVAEGFAIEGAGWNLFARVGGRWRTPLADGRLLPGVARAIVLDAARQGGVEIDEGPVPIDQIEAAFATNALLPMAPLTHLDGVALAPAECLAPLRARFDAAAEAPWP